MRCLENEIIKEDFFDEMLADLQASQIGLQESVETLNSLAEEFALERFEELN